MRDSILLITCLQILCLWIIDYFDGHGFGVEATLATINALIMFYLHNKEKKK